MRNTNLLRNILLAFIFFFIGRFLIIQMGMTGYWVVGGLVVAFYVAWYLLGWRRRNK
jgi:hypothetical protein